VIELSALSSAVPFSVSVPTGLTRIVRAYVGSPFGPRGPVEPPLVDYGNGHLAACHHPLNVDKETLAQVTASHEHTPETADESAVPREPGKEDAKPVTGLGDP